MVLITCQNHVICDCKVVFAYVRLFTFSRDDLQKLGKGNATVHPKYLHRYFLHEARYKAEKFQSLVRGLLTARPTTCPNRQIYPSLTRLSSHYFFIFEHRKSNDSDKTLYDYFESLIPLLFQYHFLMFQMKHLTNDKLQIHYIVHYVIYLHE